MNEMETEEEKPISVMDAFCIVWHKFVEWSCKEGKLHLPPDTNLLLESSIRQPPMLALLTANDMLKQRVKGEGGWEEVENRRKVIRNREWESVETEGRKLLLNNTITVPKQTQDKLFDYANVIMDLIDEMNE